jgi:flagellar basal-body rod protein FlgB
MNGPELLESGPTPLLEKTLAFAEARQRMLATNIANLTTPGYHAKQLDTAAFQNALREAAQKQSKGGGSFALSSTREFRVDEHGLLKVTPSETPAENLLFQDGTNASIERQMAQLAENALLNQVSAELLKGYYDQLGKAIRGRVA